MGTVVEVTVVGSFTKGVALAMAEMTISDIQMKEMMAETTIGDTQMKEIMSEMTIGDTQMKEMMAEMTIGDTQMKEIMAEMTIGDTQLKEMKVTAGVDKLEVIERVEEMLTFVGTQQAEAAIET